MSGPAPRALTPLTVPASCLYRLAIAARNRRFDRGAAIVRLDRPVISVGNITAGGTGKTPMVAWIVEQLKERGRRPVIAMRGYARPGDEPSDEEAEYRDAFPDVPVLAQPDRAAALRSFLPEHDEIDCVVLDDGFQHRRVARDLDLVLIDATRDTFNDRLLPAGWLREPLENLRRADGVIVTRAAAPSDEVAGNVERYHGRPPLAWADHEWSGLDLHDESSESLPVDWLRGRRVATMLGVGNPKSVERMLQHAGAIIERRIPARDHQRYDERIGETLRAACGGGIDALVVTPKDWVKLKRVLDCSRLAAPVVVPRVRIAVHTGDTGLLDALLRAIDRPAATPTTSA